MTKRPAVTVIIPAYNAAELLPRTLESVIGQTYEAWVAIVVDDGSTDSTREVVEAFAKRDSRIRLMALEKNHGAPAAPRNYGVASASTDWVAFLDADDIWHPQKLVLQMSAIDRSKARFSCTAMQLFTDEAKIPHVHYGPAPLEERLTFAGHRIKGRIPASSVVVKTSLVREIPFDEAPAYKAVEDYHCWLRILASGETCLKINIPLLSYRVIAGQISGSKFKMLRRMYNLHKNYEKTPLLQAVFYTATHAAGAIYYRLIKGQL